MDSVTSRYFEPESGNKSLLVVLSMNESSSEEPMSDQSRILRNLYFWVFGVVLCLLSVIGVVTNIVNIYALTLTVRVYKRPMYHCLLCMAVVDMLLMWMVLIMSSRFYLQHLNNSKVVIDKFDAGELDYCSYFIYSVWYIVVDILMTISNWSVVTMGVFRLIAVFAPFKAYALCTVKRAQITILLVCVFSIAVNLPLMLQMSIKDGRFVYDAEKAKYNVISLIFTVPTPILSVLIINIILIVRIRLSRAQMQKLREGQNYHRGDESAKLSGSSQQNNRHGEATLIGVSLFTVIMSMPDVIYFVANYMTMMEEWKLLDKHIFYVTAVLCIYINHACNFFFYVLLNKPFRTLLWQKVRGVESAAGPSSTHTMVRSMPTRSTAYESIKLTPVAVNGNETKNGHAQI